MAVRTTYWRGTDHNFTNDLEMEPLVMEESSPPRRRSNHNRKKHQNSAGTRCCQRSSYHGLLMAVASSFMFSLCSLLVKILPGITTSELAVFRFIALLLPSLPILIRTSESCFPRSFRLLLFFRGIVGTASLLCQFYAFRHMPLADASVIIFSAPAFVAIFARVCLKESCSLFQIFLIFLTIGGIIIISRPPLLFGDLAETYTPENWKGAIAAFFGTLFTASAYIFLRKLKTVHYSVILTNFAVIAIVITSLVTSLTSEFCIPPCGVQRWLIVGFGALSFGGQYLLTKALQIEDAGPVALARAADVVFAFIWQFLWFGDVPDMLSILGAFMVTVSVFILGIQRWILSLPESSTIRRRVSFK